MDAQYYCICFNLCLSSTTVKTIRKFITFYPENPDVTMNWCDVEYAVTVVSNYHSYNIKKDYLFNKPHYDFQVTQLTAILLDSNSSQNGIYWLHMNMSQMLRHMMILMTVIMRSYYNVTVVTCCRSHNREKRVIL